MDRSSIERTKKRQKTLPDDRITMFSSRLSPADALELLRSDDLPKLGEAADAVTRRLHPQPIRTYKIERNINYTNICVSGCRFCAFYRNEKNGYVLDDETLLAKVAETVELGGDQVLLQGGLHPTLPLEWYERMIRLIRTNFPSVNVHGFSPTEIAFFADHFGLSDREVLERFREAGLGSLPGGGAEILVDRVRQELSPRKATADRWLSVCRTWHTMGGRGSATMMFGHIETLEERIEHLHRIRELQDETGGFTSFIPWTFQPCNTLLAATEYRSNDLAGTPAQWTAAHPTDYLQTLAVSRLFLDNVSSLQASRVTQGLAMGTLALSFGADDLGSVMIEENVVAAAGTVHRTNEAELRQAILSAGFEPCRR